jgi:hypothetical protein
MTTPTSDPTESEDRAINEAVAACGKALLDLDVDRKMIALDRLGELIEIEEASFDPASAALTPTGAMRWAIKRIIEAGAVVAEVARLQRESRTLKTARILGSANFGYVYILGEKLRKPAPQALT